MGVVHLIDNTPTDARSRRQVMVERMAKDLIRYDSYQNEADSIRSLFGRGYSMTDIVMIVDDARALAFQEIVAVEMSKP
jgi:SOS response regulatory protein OraA/RecX